MKKTVITLAAALALGAPLAAFAQEQDPTLIIPDSQPGAGQSDDQGQAPESQKKRKKREAEQPSADQQFEEPQSEKKKRKKQAEQPEEQMQQPEEQMQQPVEEQVEQPVKKKKKQQAEQPEQQIEQPVEEQVEQPVKKKKKQQAEQPEQQIEQPVEEQVEQPEKKKKKQQAEQPDQPTEQPSTEQTTEQPQPEKPATAEVPPEVTQYLSDTRSPKELSDDELVARVRAGRNLVKTKGLPENVRQDVANEFKKARAEAMAREQGKATGKTDGQQTTEQPTTQPPAGDQPATGETTTGKGDQVPPQGGDQTTDETAQPTVNPDKQEVQKLDGNQAVPEAEAKAKVYLDDNRPADQLKDDELRARVDGMRDLMSGNQLSRDTERALRRKLRAERDILRNRVAEKVVVEEKQDEVIPGRERRRDRNDRKWEEWADRDVLRDRRRSDELEEGELRRRIDVYRIAIYDDRYDDEERSYWRDMMERDRRYLRDRLVSDRRDRERYWRDRRDRNELNININIVLDGDREPPEYAYMDEIDDEELEDYLVAAPRRKVERRYTVEEIEEEPEVRTAMPSIEIDNIHFGFNESFVREEEVDKLERIAEVIEKILAAHPGEVFLIGGHTDAVGSPAYNLKLSKERALAVKKALTTYYVIPARNLATAGYGERYLKIPTADAEEENRRVSLQRVTPLVGEAELE